LVKRGVVTPEVYAYVATRAADGMSAIDLKGWADRVQPLLAADDPTLVGLQFRLACALDAEGDAAAAEQLYRLVIDSKVAECLPPAANNLAEILRRDRRNLDEAVMLARSAADATDAAIKAASSPPPQMRELLAACLDTLGLCQLANGSAADAVATFQKAFEQSPQKLNLRAGLVVALERVGNQEDADKVRTEGLRLLGPSFQEALDQLRAEYGVRDAAARLPASAPPS
jgi:tetratricopeptide (TPR) repeat protein